MTRILPVVLALSSACSFAVVRPSPAVQKASEPPSCRSNGWIALDLLGSLTSAGVAWMSTLRFEGGDPSAPEDHTSPYVFGAASVVMAASAIYGFAANMVCSDRVEEMTDAP